MNVIMRGVRGSIANPALDTVFYGGNTACVELRTDSGALLFFDAGTGLREAGATLSRDGGECHIFISHGHSDHIIGLWFFEPLHSPQWTTHLYLPEWLSDLPEQFYQTGLFPVPFDTLRGNVIRHSIKAGETIIIGQDKNRVLVNSFATSHPGGCLGYRVSADEVIFVYGGDHEIADTPEGHAEAAEFLKDADIAVVDAMYDREHYNPGWGHSTWEAWAEAAMLANVRNLVLTHHDPVRPDQELDKLDLALQALDKPERLNIYVAREGMRLAPEGPVSFTRHGSDWLLFLDELSRYQEENAILDRLLFKAREITYADAGTIFLVEEDELVFAYTHNDTLFPVDRAYKHAYTHFRVPISLDSIAGYVASTGQLLNLPDVRDLPDDVPYRFNESFDNSTGYRTVSMLTIPFFANKGKVTGVLQLINSLDPRSGRPCPFTLNMAHNARILARETANIIERSMLQRQGIYSILRMAAVHDPTETGPHAERVGAVSAELYQCWAERQGHSPEEIRYEKSRIRLAAMLHDVGKVGISDLILKKPGKLTDDEFLDMRRHTELGASILAEDPAELAQIAKEIALHHHQKCNGRGYAGGTDEGRLAGDAIPLNARIVAIADVFDALVSPRCYKKPWTFEEVMDLLHKEAGEHFDPELVGCMENIRDMLQLIYNRFRD